MVELEQASAASAPRGSGTPALRLVKLAQLTRAPQHHVVAGCPEAARYRQNLAVSAKTVSQTASKTFAKRPEPSHEEKRKKENAVRSWPKAGIYAREGRDLVVLCRAWVTKREVRKP